MVDTIVSKHDRYVQTLCESIGDTYDYILTNVPLYSTKRRIVTEIDILAFRDGICDVYEVKCSFRITKARKQLLKIQRLMSKTSRVGNAFFFCGQSGCLINVGTT